jgi:3-oxoacyl-[acyl-carrier-protein] synthase II
MGLITPLGLDEQTFWQNMLAGRSAIRRISAFDVAELYKAKNGAEVDSEQLAAALEAAKIRASDRTVDMGLLAASAALASAGLLDAEGRCTEKGVATIIGSGGGPILTVEEGYRRFAELGDRGMRPTSIIRGMLNVICSHLSMRYRLTGPNYMVVSACTSSTNAMGIAFRMIRDGYADRALCGGTESFFASLVYRCWDKLGVMSTNPDPAAASRPFDTNRDGFVLGEGAGMLVLESLEQAKARGAVIRGEIAGYGESSDAEHMTRPSVEGQVRAMRAALESAETSADEIGFVNAHGTATKTNDECESKSVREVLGGSADRVPVASNKSFFGHMLGASGAVETAAALLGLECGRVPPNLNLVNPDPLCNLNLVGKDAIDVNASVVMKNSFGFGGNNAVLILRKAPVG